MVFLRFRGVLKTIKYVFGLKTGSEPTGLAREDLPMYKLDLLDPIFGVPELKRRKLRPKKTETTILLNVVFFLLKALWKTLLLG